MSVTGKAMKYSTKSRERLACVGYLNRQTGVRYRDGPLHDYSNRARCHGLIDETVTVTPAAFDRDKTATGFHCSRVVRYRLDRAIRFRKRQGRRNPSRSKQLSEVLMD